jgi:hypothetical protein
MATEVRVAPDGAGWSAVPDPLIDDMFAPPREPTCSRSSKDKKKEKRKRSTRTFDDDLLFGGGGFLL